MIFCGTLFKYVKYLKLKKENCRIVKNKPLFVLTYSAEATTVHFEYNIPNFIFTRLICVLLLRFIRALNLGDFTSSLEDQIHVGFCYNYNCHPQYNTRAVSLSASLAGFVSLCACAPC